MRKFRKKANYYKSLIYLEVYALIMNNLWQF